MKRNLDGIYMRIRRNDEYEAVCLSDMTEEELKEYLPYGNSEWLRGAVIHLARTIHEIGDKFGLIIEENDDAREM